MNEHTVSITIRQPQAAHASGAAVWDSGARSEVKVQRDFEGNLTIYGESNMRDLDDIEARALNLLAAVSHIRTHQAQESR